MDRYAGDDAWREWFAICSVGGCAPANRERLRAEVESAMYAQLARFGLTRDDAGVDDPIAFFDGYFKLKGSREKGKPLKLYFAHRIRAEHLRMLASIGDNRSVEAGRDWRGLLVDLATPVAPSTSRATNVAAGTSEKDEVADACVLVLRLLD